jgi:selenocysteine lyase/cysteine desulfurase
MTTRSTPDWGPIRADYPGLENIAYLDTSSCGLVARGTVDEATAEQDRLMREGSARLGHWYGNGRKDVAHVVAAHIGGDDAGTALLQSFTSGMSRLAPMLRHRRKVLLVSGDYPTLLAPFGWNESNVVMMDPAPDGTIPMDLLAEMIGRERPQLVAISHVQWQTGFTADLDAFTELCRAHGAWSLVDATQSWCSAPIDLRRTPIDILGASGYKWPLAGFGNGFFHLSVAVRSELRERNGYGPVAALSEGHLDPVALVRLNDAVQRSTAIGVEAVAERVHQLCDLAVRRLQETGVRILNGVDPKIRAGIIMMEGGEERLAKLRNAGVQAQLRGAGIRIGIHFYNNEEDVERLVEAVHRK